MDREYIKDRVPDKLVERIKGFGNDARFRRRAVLTKGNAQWELVCCTVEGFPLEKELPTPISTRRYAQALLYEDFLTGQDCLAFAQELHEGRARLDGIELQRGGNVQWVAELVPVANDHMPHAGYVISLQFGQSGSRASVRTLLAVNQPYYPDGDEATRDWLPLRVYHGHSDSRNDHVLFLLPEVRAYIASSTFTDQGTLDVTVGGTEVGTLSLSIKGAYWEGKVLNHIEAQVENGKAALIVPNDTERLEYYLIDQDARVYDFHREDRFSGIGRQRTMPASAKQTLAQQVRKACRLGEGIHIEFKPFVDLSDGFTRKEDVSKRSKDNTKLRQVIETVAAFSNTEGGHIYLGVNPDCTVSGIGESLREWAGEKLGEASIDRYFGALKSKIKDLMHGEVTLNLSHIDIDGMLVGVIQVSPAAHGPVALQQEFHLYIRSGASNRKAPPDQWKNLLKTSQGPAILSEDQIAGLRL